MPQNSMSLKVYIASRNNLEVVKRFDDHVKDVDAHSSTFTRLEILGIRDLSQRVEEIVLRIPRKGTRFQCVRCSVFPAVAKIIVEITLKPIKDILESLIDGEQDDFRSESSLDYIDHFNILRIILEQCAEFIFSLHLLFSDFKKAFDIENRECI